jgi:hypothetical protein
MGRRRPTIPQLEKMRARLSFPPTKTKCRRRKTFSYSQKYIIEIRTTVREMAQIEQLTTASGIGISRAVQLIEV